MRGFCWIVAWTDGWVPRWRSQYRLRAGHYEVRFPEGESCFCRVQNVQTGSRAHSAPVQWAHGEMRLRPETDRSLPCSGRVMNEWSYTSTPVPWLYGVQRDLTFFFPSFMSISWKDYVGYWTYIQVSWYDDSVGAWREAIVFRVNVLQLPVLYGGAEECGEMILLTDISRYNSWYLCLSFAAQMLAILTGKCHDIPQSLRVIPG